jgi:hypothetical protein
VRSVAVVHRVLLSVTVVFGLSVGWVANVVARTGTAGHMRPSTAVRSIQVGRDARGRDVTVKVVCEEPANVRCDLIDVPLGSSRAEHPLRALLPRGMETADQWGNEIVISTSNVGDPRYSSRNPGTFELLRDGTWKRLIQQVATTITIRGHTLMADVEQTTGGIPGRGTLELIDLRHSAASQKLAYRPADFGSFCRAVSPCSTYESVHLDTRYAYWLELNVVGNGFGTSAPQSVVCREAITSRAHHLSRWISPRPLSQFTTTFALGLRSAPAETGGPTVAYHYKPTWSPANAPLPSEAGGPCATQSILTTW